MAFRSKGQQWRKRNGNDDARYQIPDQGSIGHTKDQQSNKEEEKATAFFKDFLPEVKSYVVAELYRNAVEYILVAER